MKKIVNILLTTFILLLFYLLKDTNTLPLTISFCMYILYSSIFSTTNIKNVIEEFQTKKYYYSRDKVFKYSIVAVLLLGTLLLGVSYLVGSVIDIDNLNIINIFMTISLLSNIILKMIRDYLEVIGYKKISTNLINIYLVGVLIIEIILSILLFKVFHLNNYINIILLYSVNTIVFIIITILLYILISKRAKKIVKTREETKINYFNKIKKIIISNQIETIFNITKGTYIYISVIILYYVLINKYNYSYHLTDTLITSTYFYGLIIIYLIYNSIKKFINIDYTNIKENFNNNINKIIKTTLNICILLTIISIPIDNILFGGNYNILLGLIPLLFFYILYNYIININIKYSKEKTNIIILLIGLLAKIIFELPLINAVYRMGYSLTLGSILSTVIGLIISIIIGLIFIKNKFKLNLLNNFNNILNIIYESMIYALLLVVFTLIVKVDKVGIIKNILVIIFYLFITVLFHIIKRILTKK